MLCFKQYKTMFASFCIIDCPRILFLDSSSALPASPKCDWRPDVQSVDRGPQRFYIWFSDIRVSHTGMSEQGRCSRLVLAFFYFRVDLFLSKFFSSQFGLSLLYALLSHGEKLLSSGVPLEPSIGDFETWWAFLIFHDWDYSNMQIELSTFILFCFF